MARRLTPLLALALAVLAAPATSLAADGPVVAVVDSGVDMTHPALRDHLWTNPGEVAGNGVDDDANGFVDDVHGADFVGRDGNPRDPRGHGTHVAGVVTHRGGRKGRLGAPTGARVMALRVIGTNGFGRTSQLTEAILYATARGARVINLSVAYYDPTPELEAALRTATAAGVLVVAAAGNGSEDLAQVPVYPASYHLPGMLVVAAANSKGLARWSAHGRAVVDIAAPAAAYSTLPKARYGRLTGTSQATALVSRAAAMLFAAQPDRTGTAVRAAILGGVDQTPALSGTTASGGALDVAGALKKLTG